MRDVTAAATARTTTTDDAWGGRRLKVDLAADFAAGVLARADVDVGETGEQVERLRRCQRQLPRGRRAARPAYLEEPGPDSSGRAEMHVRNGCGTRQLVER